MSTAPQRRGKVLPPPVREAIFARLAKLEPNPTTELRYGSDFQLLVAVILSAQTTDRAVNLATQALFADAPTPAAMLSLGEARLAEFIQTIGLYRSKARHVIATCAALVQHHGGTVPHDRAALEELPGVGRKTANVVLNTAFGEPTMAVDTHIFRLANRLRLAPGKTPLAVEQGLLKNVPSAYLKDAHHWLILHGRYVCKARRPECWRCPIADLCPFDPKSEPPGAATKPAKPKGKR